MSTDIKHLKEKNYDLILEGLKRRQKYISSKFFYNSKGSDLFNEISETEEYYLTRTEEKIISRYINEIVDVLGNNILFVEFGSGSSKKTKLILEHADITGYIPVDISYEHLMDTVSQLKGLFPDLKIYPMPADYTSDFKLPETDTDFSKIVGFFPGSTIGNFTRSEAVDFLKNASKIVRGGLLIGFDLIKDKRILENAYNDRQGITAEFNLNILDNINEIASADFNPDNFEHLAFFNEIENRIEMHLKSRKDQIISIGDEKIYISGGETIITEYSYKFTISHIRELVENIFTINKIWTDQNKFFALVYLTT
jgi:dimethylhistidine N-methyltransferase